MLQDLILGLGAIFVVCLGLRWVLGEFDSHDDEDEQSSCEDCSGCDCGSKQVRD